MDYLKLYDLEKYLFDVVRLNFERDRRLSAFDFFCIIVWKRVAPVLEPVGRSPKRLCRGVCVGIIESCVRWYKSLQSIGVATEWVE
jgi:hypothetical protein